MDSLTEEEMIDFKKITGRDFFQLDEGMRKFVVEQYKTKRALVGAIERAKMALNQLPEAK